MGLSRSQNLGAAVAPLKKIAEADAQGSGDLFKELERGKPLSVLDVGEVPLGDPVFVSKALRGQAPLPSDLRNPFSKFL